MTAVKERQDRIAALIAEAKGEGRELTTAEVLALFSDDATRLQQLEAENKRLKLSETEKAAAAFADDAIRVQMRAFPSERPALIAQFMQASEDDCERSVVVKFSVGEVERSGGRVDLLKNAIALRPQHNLDKELLDPEADGKVLAAKWENARVVFSEKTTEGTDGKTGTSKPVSEQRRVELLSKTAEGRAVLAEEAAAKKEGN